jgi:hypothetical protein
MLIIEQEQGEHYSANEHRTCNIMSQFDKQSKQRMFYMGEHLSVSNILPTIFSCYNMCGRIM